jgi:hypothetical protein
MSTNCSAAQIVMPVWEGLAGFVDAALQHVP